MVAKVDYFSINNKRAQRRKGSRAKRLKGIMAQRQNIFISLKRKSNFYNTVRHCAFIPLCRCALMPLCLSFFSHKFIKIRISSITFELKKQIYFFLLASDKKISFGIFGCRVRGARCVEKDKRSKFKDKSKSLRSKIKPPLGGLGVKKPGKVSECKSVGERRRMGEWENELCDAQCKPVEKRCE